MTTTRATAGATAGRQVTAHLFHSVNGVAESPDQWQFGLFGPEEREMTGRAIGSVTDVVIGRRLCSSAASSAG